MNRAAFRRVCAFLAVLSTGCSSSDDGGATAADGGVDSSGGVDTAAPVVCGAGAWDHDGNPTTACIPWTECRAGQRVASAGSATSDRVCAPCGTGTFSDALNATACRPWMTCSPGTRVVTAGTASNDRVCKACEPDTYADRANASSCKSATACVAGEYEVFPTSPTTDRTCGSCVSGTFSDKANAKTCSAWKTCLPGTYVTTPPSATSDRTCAMCASGTFTTSINQASCLPANACSAGTIQTAPGTATTPPTCAACESGTYCAGGTAAKVPCTGGTYDNDASAATTCVSWTECSPGQFVASAGSALADRTCSACGPSSFSTTKNAAGCASWTNCPAGTFASSPGRPDSDRVCAACPPGTLTATANQAMCAPIIFTERFPSLTGGGSGTQCATGNVVRHSTSVAGWSASGTNVIHGVEVSTGNFAVNLFANNVIVMATGIAANNSGAVYTVQYNAGPSVWAACFQATAAGDGLIVEVLRPDNSVLKSHLHVTGAWAGAQTLSSGSFTYIGDGTGLVRLRVSTNVGGERFGGAIDDIVVSGP